MRKAFNASTPDSSKDRRFDEDEDDLLRRRTLEIKEKKMKVIYCEFSMNSSSTSNTQSHHQVLSNGAIVNIEEESKCWQEKIDGSLGKLEAKNFKRNVCVVFFFFLGNTHKKNPPCFLVLCLL